LPEIAQGRGLAVGIKCGSSSIVFGLGLGLELKESGLKVIKHLTGMGDLHHGHYGRWWLCGLYYTNFKPLSGAGGSHPFG